MSDKDYIVLQKILKYVDEALSYVGDMDYAAFVEDRKTLSATAFVIGQIGELANNISEEMQKTVPDINWRGMRGLRLPSFVQRGVICFTVAKSNPPTYRTRRKLRDGMYPPLAKEGVTIQVFRVIASAAKQSREYFANLNIDCRVAPLLAMTQ